MRSKVSRLIDEYELSGLGEELERAWTGSGEERRSLRELAGRVNRRLLRAVMERAGMAPLDGEVQNTYRLLTDDEISSGTRSQARKRLERNGIDVERLEGDFVSYQAVRTYLTKCRDVSHEPEGDSDRVEKEARNIQRLRTRTATITEEKLGRLEEAGLIDVGALRLLVDVRVLCEACGKQYSVDEFLERGHCACSGTDPTEG